MNNKEAYSFEKLAEVLKEKQAAGLSSVFWRLTSEQVEFIRNSLGYRVKPELYRIKTKEIKFGDEIFKEIDNSHNQGIEYIFKRVSRKSKQILEKNGIQVVPFKYRIFLNENTE